MELKLEIATGIVCLCVSSDLILESAWGAKSLEGDCGMDIVPRCRLLTPFQEGTYHKLLAQEKI